MRNPEAGGAEVHLHEVAVRLVRAGFTCIQYSHAFPGCLPEEDVGGVLVKRVGGKFLFNFTVWMNVRAWCSNENIDVIIDDSNKIPFLLPWFANRPVVAQIHHLFGRVLFHETAWPMAIYVLAFESLMPWCYRRVRVLTGSDSSRRELIGKGFGSVEIAPEGADLDLYRPVPIAAPGDDSAHGSAGPTSGASFARAGSSDGSPRGSAAAKDCRILYVGRIKRYKGLDVILRAASRLKKEFPELQFDIAGSGDDVPRLKALARELGMESWTHFHGFVSEARKVELYSGARAVVNSSLKEGWGLTSIEANACGSPVVATNVPGLCDSVWDGETGFLVPFGDADAFASALRKILGDPAEAERLRANGLAWAARHTWEKAYEVTRDALLAAWTEATGKVAGCGEAA